MRLLVYTPTFGTGLQAECRASVAGQRSGHDWVWVVDDADPYPAPDHRNVLAKYQRARQMALENGFDALITVEHDMVLPSDALDRLANTTEAGVVYAPYMLRHGTPVLSLWQYIGSRNLGMPLGLYPAELSRLRQAGVGIVSGVGWGCTLIWRSVLERIPFHDGGGANPAGDVQFAEDCLRAGVVAMGRFDCPVGHFTEEGRLLMPYEEMEPVEVEPLESANVMLGDGRVVRLVAGQRISVSQADAYELARAGYIERPAQVERAVLPSAETAVAPAGRRRREKSG